MNAKDLTHTDWKHIINCIRDGYTEGEVHSVQDNEEVLSGWWFLTSEGIIITSS